MEILRAVAEDILINDGRVLNERGKISYKGNDPDYGEKNKTMFPFWNEKDKRWNRDNSRQFYPETRANNDSRWN
jgi:hypothetical protein